MTLARVGIDIGGTKVHGAVVGPDGEVLGEARAPTRPGPEGVVETAYDVWRRLGEPRSPVGVGVPGVVDHEAGIVHHAVNLGIDQSLPLAALLLERTGCPVTLDNDLNAAAWGARVLLDEPDLVLLGLGTGLAAGLVLDGRLRRGATGAAGEIGHVPVDASGERCGCGQRGCLELYAAGSRAHDARFVRGVADAVRLAALAYDPRVVVLAGGVTDDPDRLLPPVRDALAQDAASSPFLASLALADRLRVVPGGLPVGAIGAALVGAAP